MVTRQLVRSVSPAVLQRAAEIIKLLGHPERLKIVEVLEEGEATVSEVQEAVGLPQAIVSQHLAKMRGADIVTARRDGVHVFYRIREPKVPHILRCIRTCDM
ncbi:MAG TPA: metalloregulator ArsR/SmtB family transcription factor [Gemmatimonadales bacterium]|jgi:ArsR family transcriptional regulator|nr:metalloregulator ArsR/SmtB family transcription factor [Gemmatimonadales bacterium]